MIAQPLFQSLVLAIPEVVSNTRFASYLRQSLQFDFAGLESRTRLQQDRLHFIQRAAGRTKLYRDLIAGSQGENDWRKLVITKSDIRRYYPSGVFSRCPEKDWQYLSTSGTTDRLSVVADFVKRDHRRSSELRTLSIATGRSIGVDTVEIPPNVCNVVCGIDDTLPPTIWQHLWGNFRAGSFNKKAVSDLRGLVERNVLLRKFTLPPIEPAPAAILTKQLDHYLGHLKRQKPVILRGYPQYLLWLADRARLTEVSLPSLRFILPYGGLASSAMIARIEAGFDAVFRNAYGTSELGAMSVSCGHSPGMHIFEDLFLFEINGSTEAKGPVVVTDLINDAMPILRYQVGDVGRLLHEPCSCGRKTGRVEIMGRVQELLQLERRTLTPGEIADSFYVDQGIANARLDEVAPGCFEASIVATPGAQEPDVLAWQERFRALGGRSIKRLKCRVVTSLRPETSGKYLLVWPYSSSA